MIFYPLVILELTICTVCAIRLVQISTIQHQIFMEKEGLRFPDHLPKKK